MESGAGFIPTGEIEGFADFAAQASGMAWAHHGWDFPIKSSAPAPPNGSVRVVLQGREPRSFVSGMRTLAAVWRESMIEWQEFMNRNLSQDSFPKGGNRA
jgi:hypothetical protein